MRASILYARIGFLAYVFARARVKYGDKISRVVELLRQSAGIAGRLLSWILLGIFSLLSVVRSIL